MSRISKKAVHAALERAANNILSATEYDPFVSRQDIRLRLQSLEGVEQRLTDMFYRFIDARDYRPGARVTKRDVEAALDYAREKLIDQYDLNNNGLSRAEIERMSLTGQLAVSFAASLKRMALLETLETEKGWLDYLRALSRGLVDFDYGSEADYELTPVYFETDAEELNKATVRDLLKLDPQLPEQLIERSGPLLQGVFGPDILDYYAGKEADAYQRCLEINRLFQDFLSQPSYFIIGRDNQGIVEHPLYVLGVTPAGAIAGYRGLLIWT